MRTVVNLATVVAIVGAVAVSAPAHTGAPARSVSLTIAFWPDESDAGTVRRWALRCNPPGGSLPTRRTACRQLAAMTSAAFAPVPRNAMCTEIYGGPQKAVVKGTLHGRPVWASFRRRNGCEIDRWDRFSPWLIPPAGTTS